MHTVQDAANHVLVTIDHRWIWDSLEWSRTGRASASLAAMQRIECNAGAAATATAAAILSDASIKGDRWERQPQPCCIA